MIGTVAGWREHATARGNLAPAAASDVDAAAALLRASDYIEATYPDAVKDPIPNVTERAVYHAADQELQKPNFWARTWTKGESKILTKVGDISWTPVWSGNTETFSPRSSIIEGLLRRYSRRPRPTILST